MTVTLPATTTDRLLAIADHLEAHPELWDQSIWVQGIDTPGEAAGRGICDTPGCIAGEGVMLTPPDQIQGITSWDEAGAVALGLTDELARTIFAGNYQPENLPGVLRVIAGIREGNRTREAFVKALVAANLRSADLGYADLGYANLRYANLGSANLGYANLRYANLGSANLGSANLGYANLRSANLRYANLRYANLRYANLRYANLRYANLRSANLGSAKNLGEALNVPTARGNEFTKLPDGWSVDEGSGLIVRDGEA